MKNKIVLIAMLSLLLLPVVAFAKEEKYSSKGLIETLESEDIELKFENYKEDDKQVTIYLFRGAGCSYCHAFLEYLNDITEEYGKYFKLVSYEVWGDPNNKNLFADVAEFLEQQAGGVPFIVIGDQVFPGYSEQYNEDIEKAIKEQYDKKDKYDVMDELEKYQKEESRKAFFQSGTFAIICNGLITILSAIIVIIFLNSNNKKLKRKVENLEKKLESLKDSHNKEVVGLKHNKEHKDKKKQNDSSAR